MSTFRDTIRLSAEWNAVCYHQDVVRSFLDNVLELMLSLIDHDELLNGTEM